MQTVQLIQRFYASAPDCNRKNTKLASKKISQFLQFLYLTSREFYRNTFTDSSTISKHHTL